MRKIFIGMIVILSLLVMSCDIGGGNGGGGGNVTINILNSMSENIIRIDIDEELQSPPSTLSKYESGTISIPTGQTHSITISGLTFSIVNSAVLTIHVWTTENKDAFPFHIFGGGHLYVERGKTYNLRLREHYGQIGLFDN